MTNELIPELTTIDLAGGKEELIPACAEILNPDLIGKAEYAYLAWPFGPEGEDGTASSRLDNPPFDDGPGTLFVYLTDNADLYKTGRHDTPVLRPLFDILKADYFNLFSLMLAKHNEHHVFGDYFGFSYCLLDRDSELTPMGCTDGYQVVKPTE